jgi:hypothetical protein
VAGEAIVTYRPWVSAQSRAESISQAGTSRIKAVARRPIERVRLPDGMSIDKAIEHFKKDPRVESIQPNGLYSLSGAPSDPFFGNQWSLSNTGRNGTVSGAAGADIAALSAWSIRFIGGHGPARTVTRGALFPLVYGTSIPRVRSCSSEPQPAAFQGWSFL